MVLDFWAEWCGPCRMVSPIIDELANEYAGRVNIGKMNVDENDTIYEFEEKPAHPKSNLASMGIYIFTWSAQRTRRE